MRLRFYLHSSARCKRHKPLPYLGPDSDFLIVCRDRARCCLATAADVSAWIISRCSQSAVHNPLVFRVAVLCGLCCKQAHPGLYGVVQLWHGFLSGVGWAEQE